jgi:hypothetical protein
VCQPLLASADPASPSTVSTHGPSLAPPSLTLGMARPPPALWLLLRLKR